MFYFGIAFDFCYLCRRKYENIMFKNLFNTAILLIFKPSEAWSKLKERQSDDHESFLSNYIYPFFGMIAIAAFVGVLFTRKEFDLQIALKTSILGLISAFGGFYLGAYFLNELWHLLFHRERNSKLCQCFVGYASSLMFLLSIIQSLLPEFFFLRFFVLYTVYIVWEGAIPYMDVKETEQMKFTGFSTAIILLTPFIIEFILSFLMPGLRF